MPSAGTIRSRPVTVICSSPSRLPLALSASVPAATEIISPCWMRDCTISTLPPAAAISRKRAGQGFGEKSFSPVSLARTSALKGSAITGCTPCTLPSLSCSTASITGLSVGEPSARRPCSSTCLARATGTCNEVLLTRSIATSSNTIEPRCGTAGNPTTLARALLQSTRSGCCSGMAMLAGEANSAITRCGS